jgi:hypothetical protein
MSDIFTPVEIQTNEIDNPLEYLVGEGKKFADVAALAKAKLESDSFIDQLKREAAELRQEVSSKATMDEIMTQIRQLAPKPVEGQPPETPAVPSQNQDDLETVVARLLEQRKNEDRVSHNRSSVEAKIAEKWGADAQIQMNKKAKELGVELSYLQKIATESPSAFFRLVGLDQSPVQAQPVIAPRSGMAPPQTQGEGVRNDKYWQALKARNPNEYFSKKSMDQRYKDAMAQGASFYE